MQHLKKKVMDQVDFMHVDKHRNLLQGDTILFDTFLHADKHQSFL